MSVFIPHRNKRDLWNKAASDPEVVAKVQAIRNDPEVGGKALGHHRPCLGGIVKNKSFVKYFVHSIPGSLQCIWAVRDRTMSVKQLIGHMSGQDPERMFNEMVRCVRDRDELQFFQGCIAKFCFANWMVEYLYINENFDITAKAEYDQLANNVDEHQVRVLQMQYLVERIRKSVCDLIAHWKTAVVSGTGFTPEIQQFFHNLEGKCHRLRVHDLFEFAAVAEMALTMKEKPPSWASPELTLNNDLYYYPEPMSMTQYSGTGAFGEWRFGDLLRDQLVFWRKYRARKFTFSDIIHFAEMFYPFYSKHFDPNYFTDYEYDPEMVARNPRHLRKLSLLTVVQTMADWAGLRVPSTFNINQINNIYDNDDDEDPVLFSISYRAF